jgi:hypothetical protein
MSVRTLYITFKMRLPSGSAWGDATVPVRQPAYSDLLTESAIEDIKAHLLEKAREGDAPGAQAVTLTWWQWLRSDDDPSPAPLAAGENAEGEQA